MSSVGQGSSSSGTAEAVAAGCSLRELRPRSQRHRSSNNAAGPTSEIPEGLAVFSWGRGEDGQLGLGDTSDQDEPTYVDALRGVGVRQIACGSGHTVVLTTDGEGMSCRSMYVLRWGFSGFCITVLCIKFVCPCLSLL